MFMATTTATDYRYMCAKKVIVQTGPYFLWKKGSTTKKKRFGFNFTPVTVSQ
jgi:hypothetical protein